MMKNGLEERKTKMGLKMKRKLILLLLIVTNFFVFSQTRDEFEIFDFF